MPPLHELRVRVTRQPAGFAAVHQQAEAASRFLANVSRQLNARGVRIQGIALVKAAIANNIFKPVMFDAELKKRGVSVKPERIAKRFFGQYPLLARLLSRHTRSFTSSDYIKKWPLEDKILYLTSIVSRGTFRAVEQNGKKYRVWVQQFIPVNQALDLIEERYRGVDPKTGKPKSDIPDKHFEILRQVFPQIERDLEQLGVDWNKARKISIPKLIEPMPEKPATSK